MSRLRGDDALAQRMCDAFRDEAGFPVSIRPMKAALEAVLYPRLCNGKVLLSQNERLGLGFRRIGQIVKVEPHMERRSGIGRRKEDGAN